ncbi:MAG TPA: enoyl-CoA hydratase-related protein, partial [Azonexus sp.]|nr:enoyl-CoA hydratase-related protein [Azonexus sp.]
MYQTLEIERAGKVATIWMNRPAVFNAFDEQLIDELTTACQELDADPGVRIVVLGGRGKHFSAGADLNWMKRAADFTHEQNVEDARRFAGMLRTLAGMGKPTIARVQGAALGGGTGLAAACDMAVASSDAVFSTSEVKFGIIPSAISPYVLRAIG